MSALIGCGLPTSRHCCRPKEREFIYNQQVTEERETERDGLESFVDNQARLFYELLDSEQCPVTHLHVFSS